MLVRHLLQYRYQPSRGQQHSRSWRSTIREQRRRIARLLRDSPSLRPAVPAICEEEYPVAYERTLAETGLPAAVIPQTHPWPRDKS